MLYWKRQEEGYKVIVKCVNGLAKFTYVPITVEQVGRDGMIKEYRTGHHKDRKHYTIRAFYGDTFVKELPNDQNQRHPSQGAFPSAPNR